MELLLDIHENGETIGCLNAKLDRYQRAMDDGSMSIRMETLATNGGRLVIQDRLEFPSEEQLVRLAI